MEELPRINQLGPEQLLRGRGPETKKRGLILNLAAYESFLSRSYLTKGKKGPDDDLHPRIPHAETKSPKVNHPINGPISPNRPSGTISLPYSKQSNWIMYSAAARNPRIQHS